MVTHPSTDWSRRRVTSLIETSVTTKPNRQPTSTSGGEELAEQQCYALTVVGPVTMLAGRREWLSAVDVSDEISRSVGRSVGRSVNQSIGLFVWQLKAGLKHAYN